MKALLGGLLLSSSLASSLHAQTATLDKVEVRDDGVRIETSRPVEYTKSRLTDPDRLLIELPGVRCAPREIAGKGKDIAGVRIGQFVENPPVARVVLDLNDAAFEPVVVVEGPRPVVAAPTHVEAPKAAPAPAPRESDNPMDSFQSWFVLGGMLFAGLTLCVALYRIRWMRGNEAAVRAFGEQEAKRVEKKLDEDLQLLRRRVSAIEAKLAQLQEEPGAGGAPVNAEELKELRTVLRSLTETALLPKS